jgi:hypothetical protein
MRLPSMGRFLSPKEFCELAHKNFTNKTVLRLYGQLGTTHVNWARTRYTKCVSVCVA